MRTSAQASTPLLELGQFGFATMQVWLSGLAQPELRRAQALQRLDALVEHARAAVPLYAQLYDGVPARRPAALGDLPVLSRTMLMRDVGASLADRTITRPELDAFVADPQRVGDLLRQRYAVWVSSGTSGQPGLFLHDGQALATYEALETLRFRGLASLADYSARVFAGERCAVVMVTGGHFASVATAEHLRRSFPWLHESIKAFSLLTPLADLVDALNAYRPTVLTTYPTAAAILAREQSAGRLHLALDEIWTGGEYLAPLVRLRLQQAFQCRIRNGYGASECPSIAWSCSRGELHLNDDWVILEPVDAHHRPVPAGRPSHTTLLTNLANKVQPLIRYDLGDSVTLLSRCTCGSSLPVLRVEGRHDDVLRFVDRHGRRVDLLPLVLDTVLEEQASIYDYQLTQTGANDLHVALGEAERARATQATAALAHYLAQNDIAGVTITIDAHPPRTRSASGKLRRIVCAAPAASSAGAVAAA